MQKLHSRRHLVPTAVLALGLLFTSAQSAKAVLVTNGDFETGDFTGWTLAGDSTQNFVDTGFVHSGTFAAFFGEIGSLGSLTQSIVTTPGQQYDFSFWFAGDGDSPSQFIASIDGVEKLNLLNPSFDFDYQPYSYVFTATSASTPIKFQFRDDPFYINLDDVSVTPTTVAPPTGTPEPATLSLLALPALALAITRRRRPAGGVAGR